MSDQERPSQRMRDRMLGQAIRKAGAEHTHTGAYAAVVHDHPEAATAQQFQELRAVLLDLVARVQDLEDAPDA